LDVKGGDFKNKKVIGSVKYVERVPYFFNLNYGGFRTNNLVEFSYSYRPKDHLNPNFDHFDEINKESLMSYTFRSYGYYGERPLYTLFLEGGYNYLGKFTYLGQEAKGKVLPIRSIFQLYPVKNLNLTTDSTFDPTHGRFLRTIGNLTLSYRNSSLSLGKVLERNYDGLRINDQYSLSAFSSYGPLKVSIGMIRDNKINKDIQRQLNLDYRGACWSFGLMLRDIYDGTKQKYMKEIFLTFNIFDLQKFTVPLKR
ncbi:MAG TPA: LPS-assembly protein LptD, partial [Aquificaceae bacterium]|nr:LPS-assembly protein LptD [Aquificaceae bacterium]